MYSYKTSGTCSQQINYDIVDGKVHNVTFVNGCPGNLKAIGILVLDVHEKNNNPRISLYQRFALYELPEAEQQEGAEASIVVAEDV